MATGATGPAAAADPNLLTLCNYYRDAELRGAALLMRILQRIDDPDAQVKLTKQLEEELHHAWLWTKRITDLGGLPARVDDGYQRRLGKELGVPRTFEQLFALTIVVEERALKRYETHAAWPGVDAETLRVLHEVTKDEKWHTSWIEKKLHELAGPDGEERVAQLLAHYRAIDARVFAEMEAKERETFGFSLADGRDRAAAL
jgi:bacterioferritin (cytochrome b1)